MRWCHNLWRINFAVYSKTKSQNTLHRTEIQVDTGAITSPYSNSNQTQDLGGVEATDEKPEEVPPEFDQLHHEQHQVHVEWTQQKT